MVKLYLDTSVYGGYFESEFELWTKILFDKIFRNEFQVLFSDVVDSELEKAPENVKQLTEKLNPDNTEFITMTEQAIRLADDYLNEKVVGRTSRADCFHIALATLNNADVLVSWNFRHIVNFKRIRGYNAVNYKNGYKILDIRTPREILDYEEDN